jgi:hypothetical protein
MKRLYLGAIAAAVALWACQGDPTASLRGGPFQLRVTPDVMFISEGDARTVEVLATDEQLNPLPLSVTGTSGDEAIFTVEADTLPPTNNVRSRFFVSALDPGQATLTLQGGGLSKGATINVLPVAFAGAIPSSCGPRHF